MTTQNGAEARGFGFRADGVCEAGANDCGQQHVLTV